MFCRRGRHARAHVSTVVDACPYAARSPLRRCDGRCTLLTHARFPSLTRSPSAGPHHAAVLSRTAMALPCGSSAAAAPCRSTIEPSLASRPCSPLSPAHARVHPRGPSSSLPVVIADTPAMAGEQSYCTTPTPSLVPPPPNQQLYGIFLLCATRAPKPYPRTRRYRRATVPARLLAASARG